MKKDILRYRRFRFLLPFFFDSHALEGVEGSRGELGRHCNDDVVDGLAQLLDGGLERQQQLAGCLVGGERKENAFTNKKHNKLLGTVMRLFN